MSRCTSQFPAPALALGSASHVDSNQPAYIPPGVRRTIRCYDNHQFVTQRTDGLQPYPRIDTVRPGVAEHYPWATGLCHVLFLQIMTRASFGMPREGNRILDNEEHKARWMNDSFPEFHNDNALSLGAKGNLPSGYIVSLLWVLKQFAWLIPSR